MLIITACSGRKTFPPAAGLHASELPMGMLNEVGATWSERIREADASARARDLYCGRAFREAETATQRCRGRLVIVSAGLGFVDAEAKVPAYSLTVAAGSRDNVLDRITDDPSPRSWWSAIRVAGGKVENLTSDDELILVALPGTYLDLAACDLSALVRQASDRVRIFTRSDPGAIDPRLRAAIMPYDARLDGPHSPLPGTRADFAQRALRHFVETVLASMPHGDLEQHRARVSQALARWALPRSPTRRRQSDEEIRLLIRQHWSAAGGRSGRMLRVLRDEVGVACEQARFAALFAEVRAAVAQCCSADRPR